MCSMDPKKFDAFFNKLSTSIVALDVAKEDGSVKGLVRVNGKLPLFEAIDFLEKEEGIAVSDRLSIRRRQLMNHPIKVLFYLLVTQIEYQLYKVLKNSGLSENALHELNFNDLVRQFLSNESLTSRQTIYKSRLKFKDDLKAISSFRNVLMHSNKKMNLANDYKVVLKRKKQALSLLKALNDIFYSQNPI